MTELARYASPELEGTGALLAVPLGATEQHGPHLPLSTDTDIAVVLAQRLARVVPDVVVAPPLAYGASGEHQGFAGTVSIGQEALELLVVELSRSATETFPRVLLVSAHGGNAETVGRAVRVLRAEGRDVRAWSPAAGWRGDAHAGQVETSVMLRLDAGQVRCAAAAVGNTSPLRDLMPALRSGGVAAVSPNGVLGDPRGASAADGERLLAAAVDELAGAVHAWPANAEPSVWL